MRLPHNSPSLFSVNSQKYKQMKLKLLAALTGMLLPVLLAAQAYHTLENTSEKARKAFYEGEGQAKIGNSAVAQGYFEQALKADPLFINAKLSLGEVMVDQGNLFKAEQTFEEALIMAPGFSDLTYFRLAEVEWNLEQYKDVVEHLTFFLKSGIDAPKSRQSAEFYLRRALFILDARAHPVPFNPTPLGDGVNTPSDEYFPVLTADGETLIFTRRDTLRVPPMNWLVNDENFFSSKRNTDSGNWETARPLVGVNTDQNEGAQTISPDGAWLVFTACNRSGDGSQGSCDLYWSMQRPDGWSPAKPFSNTINGRDWDSQPCISADGKAIYFSSNRAGGYGGADLWVTYRQPNGRWTTPENLGPAVNSIRDENAPYLHPDGRSMYFSSNGHVGMGGFDLFVTRRENDSTWTTPQNLGFPINTKADENTLFVSLDGKTAYYAANRQSDRKDLDIYQFDLPQQWRPSAVNYAKARVRDAVTGYPLQAKVEFVDLANGQVYVSATTKTDGTFLVCLPAGKDYALNVSKTGYFFHSENFNLLETASFEQPFRLNVELQPLPDSAVAIPAAGKPIVLRNVFFATGSADLQPASAYELDRLAALLNENPQLKIRITGHTDNVGNDANNQQLSDNRARAVMEYLIGKGIAAERLQSKGYGESKPVDANDTPEGRANNRRTEFEIW
jgi:outer membrane protein OmpA-like peptidoglycan-associated protein